MPFLEEEAQNFVSCIILMCFLENDINFQIEAVILRRPYNFGVFHCKRPKFGNMICFDVFSLKMSLVFKFIASMTSSI